MSLLTIRDRYEFVLEDIQDTCHKVGRRLKDIKLVVVTKSHSASEIIQVYQAGARNIGENYFEDALPKINELKDYPDISWHMVGHIQSRKTKYVAGNFDIVHSVDRYKIARRINQEMVKFGEVLPILLECNVSAEESKYGWKAWDTRLWKDLAKQIEPILQLENLNLIGLMTMAPYFDDPEKARPFYKKLSQLLEFLNSHIAELRLFELSMGMSNDYRVAIEEGSTMLRIGTAIMGERKY